MDDKEHEVIRLAIAADAPALRNLLYRAYEPIRMLNLKWPAAYVTQDAALANIERNECYVLEKDGSIAATITYSLEGDVRDVTDLPFIKWFAVDPVLQGHRLGARLIRYVEQTILLGKYKWPAVTLATAERHPWLAAMYRRSGYESILEFDSKNGDGNMYLMCKVLNSDRFERYIREHPADLAAIHNRTRLVNENMNQ